MKSFQINKYNSLNIFNFIISSFIIILISCLWAELYFAYSATPIHIIYFCLKILPFLLVLCGLLITKFFFFDKKNKILKNTPISKIITIINVIVYFLLIGICFLFISYETDKQIIKNHNNYTKALQIIKQQEKITHFPKKIPSNAKNYPYSMVSFISTYRYALLHLLGYNEGISLYFSQLSLEQKYLLPST